VKNDHYPVKRKGEPRRLNPNLDGIAWLEGGRFLDDTDLELTSVGRLIALGWYEARQKGMYPRALFETFDIQASSFTPQNYLGCPGCDDFSRTARCADHHDRDGIGGLMLGAGRRYPLPPLSGISSLFTQRTVEVVCDTLQGPARTLRIETSRVERA
jgi:hypothetical protein